MSTHAKPTTKKKKKKKQTKKHKKKPGSVHPYENGRTYGIDNPNLG